MAKFVKAAFQKDMIKVVEGGKEAWFDCDPKAKAFASSFKEGDEVDLVTETRNGKPFITQVRRPGATASAPVAPKANTQVAPVASAAKPAYTPKWEAKTPDVQALIVKQSTMSSAANLMQVMTGQINDINVLGESVISLYNRMLAEINK
jgi:hypothetical protein